MMVCNMPHPLSVDDHSRVVLSQMDLQSGKDYINASFVDVSNYYSIATLQNYYININPGLQGN